MWKVRVSTKEKAWSETVKALQDAGVPAEGYNLELCDVAFVRDDRVYVQAEIKKHADLLASIGTDFRYQEQCASIAESGVPYCFYLIEGLSHPAGTSVADQTRIEHALTRIQLSGPLAAQPAADSKRRCHIAAVPLANGVLEWIKYVHRNLVENPEASDGVFAPLCENVRHHYGPKPPKRDQAQVYVEQLARLSGISEAKAQSLAAVFPSLSELLRFLREAPDQRAVVQRLRDQRLGLADKAAEALFCQLLSPAERPFEWAPGTKVKRARK